MAKDKQIVAIKQGIMDIIGMLILNMSIITNVKMETIIVAHIMDAI